jgi:phosphopantothenoylcysteine decarboxylase/phosphopantothenate--cysteine ligase, prokaryotic
MAAELYHYSALRGRRLHLGVCGSVAAYKSVSLMRLLQKAGVSVNVTLTEAAAHFITPLTFEALGAEYVFTRMFGQDDGQSFAHLIPGQCAHAYMVAPCSADALARIANGFASEILCAQVLAFDGPVVLAPAMNPRMWNNRATQDNLGTLKSRGIFILEPNEGQVACGDTGQGKLADVDQMALEAAKALISHDMQGKQVLLTLGPTQELWDGVRIWTNLSSGLMGASLAQAAYLRGATVHAVAGPGVPELPQGVIRHSVRSAVEMFSVAEKLWPDVDFGIFTAAVADFYPEPHQGKFKKRSSADGMSIRFLPNPDILATLGAKAKANQKILAFAAETDNIEEQSRQKLVRKKAHLLAGNLVGKPDSGFAVATNQMFVCDQTGREEYWPCLSKADVAWRLLDWLLTL